MLPKNYAVKCDTEKETSEVMELYIRTEGKLCQWNYVCFKSEASAKSQLYYTSTMDLVKDFFSNEFFVRLSFQEWKDLSGKESTLPEKWYVVVTNQNRQALMCWRFDDTSIEQLPVGSVVGYCTTSLIKAHDYSLRECWVNEIPFEQFEQHVLKKIQSITRRQLILLRSQFSCLVWRDRIDKILIKNLLTSGNFFEIEKEILKELSEKGSLEQKAAVTKIGVIIQKFVKSEQVYNLIVGDKVKVLRRVEKGENGENYRWIGEMERFIGEMVIIKADLSPIGFLCYCEKFQESYSFPHFILEKIMQEENTPLKTKKDFYIQNQQKQGLVPGNKVKILRKAFNLEYGWEGLWHNVMDKFIGTEVIIKLDTVNYGFYCYSEKFDESYNFPYFVLEETIQEKSISLKTKKEIYIQKQDSCGLVAGDKIRVLRKANSYEDGWQFCWMEIMNKYIGQEFIILETREDMGIRCKAQDGNVFNFPYFVLEKIEKKYLYLPFDFNDDIVGKVIMGKYRTSKILISYQSIYHIQTSEDEYSYEALLKGFMFLDGTPCGKLK